MDTFILQVSRLLFALGLVPSVIGWKGQLHNDLFCVEWDVNTLHELMGSHP